MNNRVLTIPERIFLNYILFVPFFVIVLFEFLGDILLVINGGRKKWRCFL